MIGLFELAMVLAVPIAWGLYELRTLKRDRLQREAEARKSDAPSSRSRE